MYGFKKEDKLKPVITFVLYAGEGYWDGPHDLCDMIDYTDIPEELQMLVSNYRMNVISIHQFENTEVFKTEVRHVFDFIRCSNDKNALKKLVETDDYYKNMEEDAFDVAVQYTNATELIEAKEYYEKEGMVDMCKALTELIADGKQEGRAEGRAEEKAILIKRKLERGDSIEKIADDLREERAVIEKIVEELQ